jgi:calcyphosin
MNERRRQLVNQAFNVLDKDGSGTVEPDDIIGTYDASKHPDVLAGKRSADEILREFLDTFDVGGVKDGLVTRQEFENYYSNLGVSIDNDDYFELMIRNAWHISGGEGWSANTANKRVLVTRADGSQYVEEIKDDLGLAAGDKAGMMARLKAQGVNAASISLNDSAGDDRKQTFGARPTTAPAASTASYARGYSGRPSTATLNNVNNIGVVGAESLRSGRKNFNQGGSTFSIC